jgi:hypothetical protein
MIRELSPKQKEIHDTLLTKTKTDKMDWKMNNPCGYSFVIKDYRITVSLSMEYLSGAREGPGSVATVVLQQGNDLLTSFTTPDTNLFYAAQAHCSERNAILEEVIRALDKL